jgi:hypothetical protein
MIEPIRILTIHGDYDVLIGKRWVRSFDRLWKARLYRMILSLGTPGREKEGRNE